MGMLEGCALPRCDCVGVVSVLCYVVWWCAEGAVTRRQWPGCLPTSTGKREGRVSGARVVCVVIGGKWGGGETWMSPTRRLLSSEKFPLYPLSLRLLVQAQLLNTTPLCCWGPCGLSVTWPAPWRGRTRL